MLKKHNIQSWLKDNPNWNAPQDKPAQTLFIPSDTHSTSPDNRVARYRIWGSTLVTTVPDSPAELAATHSTSPDDRVAQYRIWGSTLVTTSESRKQVKLGILSQDFEKILHMIGSKSN
eukprot:15224341-Ditylum_brightwellii.AAC.1